MYTNFEHFRVETRLMTMSPLYPGGVVTSIGELAGDGGVPFDV